ncbi:MAG: TonB-dependent receptor, partial [Bryobacteraceae bacterium]
MKIVAASFAVVSRDLDLTAGAAQHLRVQLALEPLSASVVVTAEASPAELGTTTAPVTTITRTEINQRAATSLPDLLATLPGFSLARTGREGGQATLFLDGANSNHTKVLVDGAPVNDSGGFMDFSNFTLDNVEKIEVVHGAESAIYGSDAMAGVIQVFTRRGTTRVPQLTLTGDGGSFATGRGEAELSGLLGRFDYSGSAGYFSTNGQGPNDRFLHRSYSGAFGWKFADQNTLRLTLRDNSSGAGIPGQTLYLPPNLDSSNGLHDFIASLVWNAQTGEHWRWRVAGTEASLHDADTYAAGFTSISQFNRAAINTQSSYWFRQGTITAGYDYEAENGFPGALLGEHAQRLNQAGYLDFRWLPVPRLTLNAGARAEDNASFGTRVVPRAGASYLLRKSGSALGPTRLHAFYGQGIDEPRLDQSFG